MNKTQWLEACGWFWIVVCILASLSAGASSYLVQFGLSVMLILQAKKKIHTKMFLLVASGVMVLLKLVLLTGPLDLIDLGFWGIVFALLV